MKKTTAILLVFFYSNTNAQTWVTIPDANFVSYLQSIIPAAMSGNQMNTSSPLVTTTTHSINVIVSSISNLSGIQYFSSLTYLECANNSITTLPTLPNSLTYMDCGNNPLTSLPVLPSSLLYLDCCCGGSLNALPSLPNSLQTLICSSNPILSLPILPNSLTYLDCSGNLLTHLPTLPNSLQILLCENNSLTNVPIMPITLQTLQCENNNISCFPTFPHSITLLDIDPNPYNCLPNYIHAMGSDTTTYPLCLVGNSNGCAVVGIEQFVGGNEQVNIYPNPNNGSFIVETNSTEKQNVTIYDINDKVVLSQDVKGTSNIDGSTLSGGVYIMNITRNNNVSNKRLVIIK